MAKVVYYPDEGAGQINNFRSSSFELTNLVAVFGGFDTNDKKRSDRDPVKNVTVLSGDIEGNDITDAQGVVQDTAHIVGNNAYNVASAKVVGNSAVLDGFAITGGTADGGSYQNIGGGFYCDGSDPGKICEPGLKNIKFTGNAAMLGGGMYNGGSQGSSNPSLTNVIFSNNRANLHGGAMVNDGDNGISSPRLVDVVFSNKRAGFKGGAVFNDGEDGGEVSASLLGVAFSGNSAGSSGGAMHNECPDGGTCSPELINVLFSGNSAEDGEGMYNDGSTFGTCIPVLTNVTFSGNAADARGGAMYNRGFDNGTSSPVVRNGILWNNKDSSGIGTKSATIYNESATVYLNYSLAQGAGASGAGWTPDADFIDSGGNIHKNPGFRSTVNPSSAPTTSGNLRLKSDSPALDAGINTYVSSVTSDLDGAVRIVDGNLDGQPIVDMGAFEFQMLNQYLTIVIR